MSVIYLIRHGEAAASWNQDRDPGLSSLGREQALHVKERFASHAGAMLFSSPLLRARETATPLADHWGVDIDIRAEFSEIPAPSGFDLEQRLQWLLALRDQGWNLANAELLDWRSRILAALKELPDQAIVFTHFMVMNMVVGRILGRDDFVCYQPANGSILTLERAEGGFQIVDIGHESTTKVL